MARKPTNIDAFLHLLAAPPAGGRLSEELKRLGVPRSTYYFWRKRLQQSGANASGVVRALELENRRLRRERAVMQADMEVLREALGKPWRR